MALKSLVTTEMARKVAEVNGLKCYDTFTGFKFLAQKKDQLEAAGEGNVIMAYEESYGYMLGGYVRDKDAVTAAVALTEMAAWYAGKGMTLADALNALYEKYGDYGERTMNLVMPGLDGLKKMADLMANLRKNPPEGDRRRDGQNLEGLQGRQRGGRRHRRKDRHGAVRLQRAALRAGGRHLGHRAALRHRAQGEGVHTGPGRQPG